MNETILRKILLAYFEGKATPMQKQMLAEWLKDSSGQELFYEVLHEWEKAHPQLVPDVEEDWSAVVAKLENKADAGILHGQEKQTVFVNGGRTSRRMSVKRTYLWLAASFALLALTGWWQRGELLYKTYTAGFGETATFVLSDGSRVILNADSKLTWPRFASLKPVREAYLHGEAEFSVVHTKDDRPFLVRTPDQLEVRVLGTEFVVYSRKEEESKVILTKGKVQLRSLKTATKPLDVRPGEVVTVDRDGAFRVAASDSEVSGHLAWKEHRFIFNRTPLSEIARQIRERFGVELVIPDSSLASRQLNGNYPAQSADDVIEMITRAMSVRSEKLKGRKVLLLPDHQIN